MATQVAFALAQKYRAQQHRALRWLAFAFREPGPRRDAAPTLEAWLARRLGGHPHESLICLFYGPDGNYRAEHVRTGTVDIVAADREALARRAIEQGARHVVIAHNHPGGEARPSAQDVRATRELHALFAALGMRLHDHVIVARGGALFSFRRAGLM